MGYIYLIGELDSLNTYKIGVTKHKNIEKRIAELQTGNAKELYVRTYFQSKYPYKLEKMLHIDDIKEKLARNPEPDFVKETRENIIQSFSRLQFLEEGHKYFVHQDDGTTISLPSVSHVCHQFQPEVDWEAIAQRKAIKEGIPKEELQRQWKENNIRSTNNGTITHEFGEAYMYFFQGRPELMPERVKLQYEDGFLIPYGNKEKAICKFYEDIYRLDNFYPVMPEARIYTGLEGGGLDLSQNYSGTFDMLFACQIKGKWKLILLDWKTNASLENAFNQAKSNTLLNPFSYMIDEPKSIYTIQLSLYQMGLEQLGYEIADRKIIWLKDDGDYEKISVPDVTLDLKNVLK